MTNKEDVVQDIIENLSFLIDDKELLISRKDVEILKEDLRKALEN